MEIAKPTTRLHHRLLSLYLGRMIPWLSRWTTGQQEAQTLMRYYWDTIEHCVAPEGILQAMTQAGFAESRCQVDWGMFRSYIAHKV